jgi:hypothetical protein
MKSLFTLSLLLCIAPALYSQAVGIGTSTPNASALLDITSTSKGLLAPRMNTAQRTGIVSPVKGLLVYDTDLNSLYHFNGSGWATVGGGGGGFSIPFSQTVNTGISAFQVINQGTGAAIEGSTTNEFGVGTFAKATGYYGWGLNAVSNRPGANSIYAVADSGIVFHGENNYTGNTNTLMSLLNRGVAKTVTLQLVNNSSTSANMQIAGNNLGEQLLVYQTNAANTLPAISVSNSGTGAGVSSVANNGTGVTGTSISGNGIIGTSSSSSSSFAGVYGINNGTQGSGVQGVANFAAGYAVKGESNFGTGVYGYSGNNKGVSGSTISGTALYGNGGSGYGLESVGKVKISGGNTSPVSGAVLTSLDASGNAVWKNNRIGFSAEWGSTSLTAGAATLVNFATQIFDASDNFNTSAAVSNPNSFIAPLAGFYHFDAAIKINIASGVTNISSGSIYLMKNGVVNTIEDYGPPENTAFHSRLYMNFSHDIYLNAGDIINLKIYQDNATNIAATILRGRFSGHLIFAD